MQPLLIVLHRKIDSHHMVIKQFLLLGLAAECRSRRWMWSTLPPTIRCLWHSLANQVDSAWDDQPLTSTQRTKNRSFSHPLGDLGVTYALHLWLVGKLVVDFLFIVTELFCYLLQLRHCKQKSVKVGVFRRGWATFGEYLTGKGASPTNCCWCQKTRVIAVSWSMKISAVLHLVLSQYTHLTDEQTDRQNCDGNTVRCITCSCTVETEASNKMQCIQRHMKMTWLQEPRCNSLVMSHNHRGNQFADDVLVIANL